MKMYFDTNIFQDLKSPARLRDYNSILQHLKTNQYFFSEAHLHDLHRDLTDRKFPDMDFIETVTGKQGLWFDKSWVSDPCTPKDYYLSFDWPDTTRLDGSMSLLQDLRPLLEAIPTNFGEMASNGAPEETPTILQATNLSEFATHLFEMASRMAGDQKEFKSVLEIMHGQSALQQEKVPLEGFDGVQITDRIALRASLQRAAERLQKRRDDYDLFMGMYQQLEFLGLVKGRLRKQAMFPMINDSRHCYFGQFVDVLVSNDEDLCRKATFLYDVLQVPTQVMSWIEFSAKYLSDIPAK